VVSNRAGVLGGVCETRRNKKNENQLDSCPSGTPIHAPIALLQCDLMIAKFNLVLSMLIIPNSCFHVGIVGGGLAGINTAYHLIRQAPPPSSSLKITIIDPSPIGQGGATGVAGGILHPRNPRGTSDVYRGREGLESTKAIIREADEFAKRSSIISPALYKIDRADSSRSLVDGGIVVDVAAYLENLFSLLASSNDLNLDRRLLTFDIDNVVASSELPFDAVVFAAGASCIESDGRANAVRGQAIIFKPTSTNQPQLETPDALIFGQYAIPQPKNRVMIGSTLEPFPDNVVPPLSSSEVIKELYLKTAAHAPKVWNRELYEVEAITSAQRVQTYRSEKGRPPILKNLGGNSFLFTGLGSRGLLYGSIGGSIIAASVWESLKNPKQAKKQMSELKW